MEKLWNTHEFLFLFYQILLVTSVYLCVCNVYYGPYFGDSITNFLSFIWVRGCWFVILTLYLRSFPLMVRNSYFSFTVIKQLEDLFISVYLVLRFARIMFCLCAMTQMWFTLEWISKGQANWFLQNRCIYYHLVK